MSDAGAGGRGRVLPQVPKPPEAPRPPEVKSSRLLLTLGTAGALAGLLIVFVYEATQPTIRAHKAEMLRLAIEEVLSAPYRYDTLYVYGDALTPALPEGVDREDVDMVFVGYDENGERAGFAITGAEPGFQDVIELIFGYDPATRQVLGMKVLTSRETPGLGDRIEKDSSFLAGFEGVETPLVGVKAGRATGAANEVDLITGATISSRAVVAIINHRLEKLAPLLDTYVKGESE
jgi:electron transport complex protein RnfG